MIRLSLLHPRHTFRIAGMVALALLAGSHAHAISSRTLLTPTGAAVNDFFGYSVASAGDVNGDGFADVIVGAYANDAGGTSAGRAYVYYGGPSADAVADLTLTGAEAGEFFGYAVAPAGDVNGDGFDDVIVGAYAAGVDAGGRAYVYYGGSSPNTVADLTLTGWDFSNLGYTVASAGDVNGDGFADVIVGAPGDGGLGQAFVYYGGSSPNAVADLTLTGAVADFFGHSVASAGDVNGDGFADVIVGAYLDDAGGTNAGRAYVYYGGPSADTVADLTLTGAEAGEFFGYAVASAGDVNRDGFDDMIVGAYAAGVDAGGRAYVYYGGSSPNAVADLTLTGWDFSNLGYTVASAGDVNGDGFADVIVGAPGDGGLGQAFVYYGGSSPNAVADLTLTGAVADFFGHSVASAGDVNGDGFADVIVGAHLNDAGGSDAGRAYVVTTRPYDVISPHAGEQWVVGQSATVRWLGHDVADLAISSNGGATWTTLASGVGGAEDNSFTVSVPGPATDLARVRVSANGEPVSPVTSDVSDGLFRIVLPVAPPAAVYRPLLYACGAATQDFYGYSVASGADADGDGLTDWIVGAPLNDAGGANAGRAYILSLGTMPNSSLTLTGAAAGDEFGHSVASAGDVNGDGFADWIVGAYASDAAGLNAGRAYVYYGGPLADQTADLVLTGEFAGDFFGWSVATAGDVNGDGFADVMVGAPLSFQGGIDAGRAYVYYGGRTPNATADLVMTGAAADDELGHSVASAGDVNGDGFADWIVGAWQNDGGGFNAGRAYVYYGGRSPNATVDLVLTGTRESSKFGNSVASAGDVNGDGFADLIVGAYLDWAGGINAGRAFIYHGGPAADATPDLVLTAEGAADWFGNSVASAGDVNGDGFGDVIVGAPENDAGGTDAGRAYVYYCGPTADATADLVLTSPSAFEEFGWSVASAGNLSGKGFADLIVGGSSSDACTSNSGRTIIYTCNRYFVLSPNDDEVWKVGASQTVSWLGAERADLWLSVDAGRTYDLLRHDVGGAESNAVNLLVPHAPTKFARVRVTPADPSIRGLDESDSSFTIQSSVALLTFAASLGEGGAELSWRTEPGVGPEGLAGYRLHRLAPGESGNGARIGPELIAEQRYTDPAGAPGHVYRLIAINGLGEELELGRVSLAPTAPLAAWPLPYRGGTLAISFTIYGAVGAGSGTAEVCLHDLSGRLIRRLAGGRFTGGHAMIMWDGRDERGAPVRDGIYFLRATSAGMSHQLKVVVVQ